jgi:glycosyltransferase involved in cell wall biosynthesis
MSTEELPVHFFTIVLNGMPFITYHLNIFRQLPFRWHWHVVEGVAALVHDTAWSAASGGHITRDMHDRGRSNDGTSSYLDEIAAASPDKITLYRKPIDAFWDGKKEMVAAPLSNIDERCLLWQVDADELWLPEQIATVRRLFHEQPRRTAAYYWCDYFVGPNAIISTRYNYGQNPEREWLRTWRYQPGAHWRAHEPPTLVAAADDGRDIDLGSALPFNHDEMEAVGVKFQHFAYATQGQLEFKERYNGYKGAVDRWRRLLQELRASVLLRDYFPWVSDDTMVDTAPHCGVVPLAAFDEEGTCRFVQAGEWARRRAAPQRPDPQIILDGVFFQLGASGIARVWRSLLTEWLRSGFSEHVILLDRRGTAPRIPGVRYRSAPEYIYDRSGRDSLMLQRICEELGADLFVSTYYTTPTTTPALMPVYDMIPEVIGLNLQEPMWREKHLCIRHASAYVTISESTRHDLLRLFPEIAPSRVEVVHCGVDPTFTPAPAADIHAFRRAYKLDRPYFLLVGDRLGAGGYKNTPLFFKAFAGLERSRYAILCVGGAPDLEPQLRQLVPDAKVVCARLSDHELRLAYGGAIALVYPSRYEGFGMPVVEAMAVGCPVITCRSPALTEVAGEAACYVDEEDPTDLRANLLEIQRPSTRERLVQLGKERSQQFNWRVAADRFETSLREAITQSGRDRLYRPSSTWTALRTTQDASQRQVETLLAWVKRFEQNRAVDAGAVDLLLSDPAGNYIGDLMRELQGAREKIVDMQRSRFWKARLHVIAMAQALGLRRRQAR